MTHDRSTAVAGIDAADKLPPNAGSCRIAQVWSVIDSFVAIGFSHSNTLKTAQTDSIGLQRENNNRDVLRRPAGHSKA